MKKYIKLDIFAEGSYSGATYEESLFLTEDIWNIIKEDFKEETFCIYELDGKHSCCECSVDIEEFNEEEIIERKPSVFDDGMDLYYVVEELMKSNGIKNSEEVLDCIDTEVHNLLKLYPFEDITVTIRKENKDKLMEFVKNLQ